MDERKIAFISCVNDEEKYEKCLSHLERLCIPEGMTVVYIPVRGASSMASGYERARRASDAKYKVYLHQDVYIIETAFLCRLIEVFRRDETIGAAGVIGETDLATDAWALGKKVIGGIYDDFHVPGILERQVANMEGTCPVETIALDGCLIATQYDVPWREDIFKRWDFYDISICFEHRRRGKRVVVLPQAEPYVEHHCGKPDFTHYEAERKRFIQEYSGDQWTLSTDAIAIVIPARNALAQLKLCIPALMDAMRDIPHAYIVVDDASTDGTQEWLVENGIRAIRNDVRQGLASCFNVGAAILEAASTMLLPADVCLTKAALLRLLFALPSDRAGVAGAVSNRFPCDEIPTHPYASYEEFLDFSARWADALDVPHAPITVSWVECTAVLFHTQALALLREHGEMLDPAYGDVLSYALYDACLRLQKRHGEIYLVKDAFVHQNGVGTYPSDDAKHRFYNTWGCYPTRTDTKHPASQEGR